MGFLLFFATSLFLALLFKIVVQSSRQKNGPYPPGPKPLPIIGNILDLRLQEDFALQCMDWGKKYNSELGDLVDDYLLKRTGDILFLTSFGTHVMIINKLNVADEFFERRSKLYSDRPQFPVVKLRVCQQNFNHGATKKYQPTIHKKVRAMLQGLLESPEKFSYHNKMLTTSITMATMYGYQVKSMDDPMIAAAEDSLALAAKLIKPGPSLLNIFPFLGKIPPRLAGPLKSRKLAAEMLKTTKYMQNSLLDFVNKSFRSGTSLPSLVVDSMERYSMTKSSDEEKTAMWDVAFTTYSAASDTTISVTSTFFYLMAKHPEVQAKARAEIDQTIGSGRLPDFEDRPSLPYVEAIYREVMRWQQSLHLAIPHSLLEDDFYQGYFIPKGTIVLGNVWAMTHDEAIYIDPFTFYPERFFNKDGKLNNDSRILAYGFGRRVCAGKHVASSVVWLMMASVLACFDIDKPRDEFGNEIGLNDEYVTQGFITIIFRHKKDYKCSIAPRAAVWKELIEEKNNSV